MIFAYEPRLDRRPSFQGYGCCSRGDCVKPPVVIVQRRADGPRRYYCIEHKEVTTNTQKAREG